MDASNGHAPPTAAPHANRRARRYRPFQDGGCDGSLGLRRSSHTPPPDSHAFRLSRRDDRSTSRSWLTGCRSISRSGCSIAASPPAKVPARPYACAESRCRTPIARPRAPRRGRPRAARHAPRGARRAGHARLAGVRGGVPGGDSHRRDSRPGQSARRRRGARRNRARCRCRSRNRVVAARRSGARARQRRGSARRRRRGDLRSAPRCRRLSTPGTSGSRASRLRRLRDRRGLAGILAVHVRHDRAAEARDASPRRSPDHDRAVRRRGARHPPGRPLLFGRSDLPRLRTRQLARVPLLGGGDVGARAGAPSHSRPRGRRPRTRAALAVLLGADELCRAARRRPTARCVRLGAPGGLGR